MNRVILTIIYSLLLIGCSFSNSRAYKRPDLALPDIEYGINNTTKNYSSVKVNGAWWENFGDPFLSNLIAKALEENKDLALGAIRLKEAQINLNLVDSSSTPGISGSAGGGKSQKLKGDTQATNSYSASFRLSYQADIFGKIASIRDQAQWQAEASEQDNINIARLLIGSVADTYWKILSINERIDVLDFNIINTKKLISIIEARYRSGAIGHLDILQAKQSLIQQEIQLSALIQQRTKLINSFSLLFDKPFEHDKLQKLRFVNNNVPDIPHSTPLSVIAQRPDVQAAELKLRAALVGIDLARLNFYPTISLASAVSTGTNVFSYMFRDPVANFTLTVDQPALTWNSIQLSLKKSDLESQAAAINFRSKVYDALVEVANYMSQRSAFMQQKHGQEDLLLISRQRLSLSNIRYVSGAIAIDSLINAQDEVLSAQLSLLDVHIEYLNATLMCWLALGFGGI